MALIKFTSLVASMHGRLGDVIYRTRGVKTHTYPHQPVVTQPGTYRQIQTQTIFKEVAAAFYDLSETSKELWSSYASMLPNRASAQNAFIKLNCSLLGCSHADLITINYPPLTPSTPKFPIAFSAVALNSVTTCISWAAPLTASEYISVYFHLASGFCLKFPTYDLCNTVGYRPQKRFIETVRSDIGAIVHTHTWPEDAFLYYKAFSLDKFGRQTNWTHKIKVIVPA